MYSRHGKIKQLRINKNVAKTIDVVAFDGENDDWGIFSNYAPTPIKMPIQAVNGSHHQFAIFPTVEHYFQYMKDPTNSVYLAEILSNHNPQHARNLGQAKLRKLTNIQKRDWNQRSENVMKAALAAKSAQHQEFRQALLATENACIIEDTGTRSVANQDGKWGFKLGGQTDSYTDNQNRTKDFPGNLLGILLMQKRNELNPKNTVDAIALSNEVKNIMQGNYPGKSLVGNSRSNSYQIDATYYKDKSALQTKSALPKKAVTSSSVNAVNNLFTKAKPRPDNPEVKSASNSLVTIMKKNDSLGINANAECIIRKGALNGTFKVGFTQAADAKKFFEHLKIIGVDADSLTYFGGNKEKYPMDSEGRVVLDGKGVKYSHIVRFEIPDHALQYYNSIHAEESLYKTIMGLSPAMKLTK